MEWEHTLAEIEVEGDEDERRGTDDVRDEAQGGIEDSQEARCDRV